MPFFLYLLQHLLLGFKQLVKHEESQTAVVCNCVTFVVSF